MNERIRAHLVQYCKKKNFSTDDATLMETIREGKRIDRKEIGVHRWWTEYRYTVEVDGILIGYIDAESSGDMSPSEMGYEVDPNSICEMRPVSETITTYEPMAGQ